MTYEARDFVIRPCRGFAELDSCVDLQEQVWGYEEREVIPRKLFIVAQRVGGQVFGAFTSQHSSEASGLSRMIGFAMALPAICGQSIYLHSHMLAVHAEWRNAGIGRALKLVQREEALARGIRKMEWTFDPLEIKNAYLNIARLGAIVRSYTPDFYGPSTSSIQAGLQTDRMHAEWFLDSGRVRAALGKASQYDQPDAPKIVLTVTVPSKLAEWKRSPTESHRAAEVQAANREVFLKAFQNRLAVVGFTRDDQGNGIYHLAEFQPESLRSPKSEQSP